MSARKKHHYIPQFYLKKFSIREEKKVIGLYNHQKDIFINEAAIRHQACEKYLYGRNGEVEEDLSKLEFWASKMMEVMLTSFIPPPQNSNAYDVIKKYLLYQMHRTLKAGNELDDTVTKAMHAVFKLQQNYEKDYQNLRVVHEDPTLVSLSYSDQMMPFMNYLSCKLLVNLSHLPFITSDNPVIKYNQFMESKGSYIGATGIAVKGLQIFFPIHPKMMICLYDPYVYKYGSSKKYSIITESVDEVHQLNCLQYLTSESQLFFGDYISKEYVTMIVADNRKRKENTGSFSDPYISAGSNPCYFVFNSFLDPTINLTLSFLKLLKKAKRLSLENKIVFPRHESFNKLAEDMRSTFFGSD